MIKFENQCYGCDIPCVGSSCSQLNVEVHYCDTCGEEAIYSIDNEDFCYECLKDYLEQCFKDLSISEQCERLDLVLEKL